MEQTTGLQILTPTTLNSTTHQQGELGKYPSALLPPLENEDNNSNVPGWMLRG